MVVSLYIAIILATFYVFVSADVKEIDAIDRILYFIIVLLHVHSKLLEYQYTQKHYLFCTLIGTAFDNKIR